MEQLFKYVEIATTQNPMDFSYQFGFNNNSPDKFCYTETLTNFGSMFSQQSQAFKNNASNDLISFTSLLNEDNEELGSFKIIEDTYDLKNYNPMNFKRMEHMKSINIKSINEQIVITTVKQSFDIVMTGLKYASNNFKNQQNGLNTEASVGDYAQLAQNIFNLISSSFNLGMSIAGLNDAKNGKTTTMKQIDNQIAILNEKIASDREFMQQTQAELDRRNRRKR